MTVLAAVKFSTQGEKMVLHFFIIMTIASLLFFGAGCSKPQNADKPQAAPVTQEEETKETVQDDQNKGDEKFKMDPRAAEFFKKAEDF